MLFETHGLFSILWFVMSGTDYMVFSEFNLLGFHKSVVLKLWFTKLNFDIMLFDMLGIHEMVFLNLIS